MKLLTEDIKKNLPEIGSTDGQGLEAVVQVKFFTPDSSWTWFATEFDGQDTFYGYVDGLAGEFGYFSLSELESVEGPMGLKIERDIVFEPVPLKEVVK